MEDDLLTFVSLNFWLLKT